MQFFFWLSIVYAVALVFWAALMFKYREEVLPVQVLIWGHCVTLVLLGTSLNSLQPLLTSLWGLFI